ncbi:hypothetical protein Q5P01_007266 [Channa striata]|uniref:Ig-like domain-containing protein n=1 Tax=Channa striata TaxID=64152 RepID=A0AA88SUP5_CHASR|nr:hypothetical protein Q5P01_007266 [Channa striata]
MHDRLLTVLSCLCIVLGGLSADECSPAVLARRNKVYVPQGGSLSLKCVVRHCGDPWTGNWVFLSNARRYELKENSDRYHLANMTLSADETMLILIFLRVNKSDEGFYGCRVTWSEGLMDQGHWTVVNITAAVPTGRNLLHRFLVCASAFLCLTVVLGLACRQCLRITQKIRTASTQTHDRRGQPYLALAPLPRRPVPKKRSTSPFKAPPQSERRPEPESTVYSSVRFSRWM